MTSASELGEIRKAYNQCAKDGKGNINKKELAKAIRRQTGDMELANDVESSSAATFSWTDLLSLGERNRPRINSESGDDDWEDGISDTEVLEVGDRRRQGGGGSHGQSAANSSKNNSNPAAAANAATTKGGFKYIPDKKLPQHDNGVKHTGYSLANKAEAGASGKETGLPPRTNSFDGNDEEETPEEDSLSGSDPQSLSPTNLSPRHGSKEQQHRNQQQPPQSKHQDGGAKGKGNGNGYNDDNRGRGRSPPRRSPPRRSPPRGGNQADGYTDETEGDDYYDDEDDDEYGRFYDEDEVEVFLPDGKRIEGTVIRENRDGTYRIEARNGTIVKFVDAEDMALLPGQDDDEEDDGHHRHDHHGQEQHKELHKNGTGAGGSDGKTESGGGSDGREPYSTLGNEGTTYHENVEESGDRARNSQIRGAPNFSEALLQGEMSGGHDDDDDDDYNGEEDEEEDNDGVDTTSGRGRRGRSSRSRSRSTRGSSKSRSKSRSVSVSRGKDGDRRQMLSVEEEKEDADNGRGGSSDGDGGGNGGKVEGTAKVAQQGGQGRKSKEPNFNAGPAEKKKSAPPLNATSLSEALRSASSSDFEFQRHDTTESDEGNASGDGSGSGSSGGIGAASSSGATEGESDTGGGSGGLKKDKKKGLGLLQKMFHKKSAGGSGSIPSSTSNRAALDSGFSSTTTHREIASGLSSDVIQSRDGWSSAEEGGGREGGGSSDSDSNRRGSRGGGGGAAAAASADDDGDDMISSSDTGLTFLEDSPVNKKSGLGAKNAATQLQNDASGKRRSLHRKGLASPNSLPSDSEDHKGRTSGSVSPKSSRWGLNKLKTLGWTSKRSKGKTSESAGDTSASEMNKKTRSPRFSARIGWGKDRGGGGGGGESGGEKEGKAEKQEGGGAAAERGTKNYGGGGGGGGGFSGIIGGRKKGIGGKMARPPPSFLSKGDSDDDDAVNDKTSGRPRFRPNRASMANDEDEFYADNGADDDDDDDDVYASGASSPVDRPHGGVNHGNRCHLNALEEFVSDEDDNSFAWGNRELGGVNGGGGGGPEDDNGDDTDEYFSEDDVFYDDDEDYVNPAALPSTVANYISARAKMERRLSATGPRQRACEDMNDQNTQSWKTGGGGRKRRGSLTVSQFQPSTGRGSQQTLPFTEAMLKAGVSETKHATKQGILLEGSLKKFSPGGLKGVRWHSRYFVLYAGSCELRYYKDSVQAAWGTIPIGERGGIPLRLVTKIEQPSIKKWNGCRFDLIVRYKGEGRYPGAHIRRGTEGDVFTTKTFKLLANDPQQRLLWVTLIESLMQENHWGLKTMTTTTRLSRTSSKFKKGARSPTADTQDRASGLLGGGGGTGFSPNNLNGTIATNGTIMSSAMMAASAASKLRARARKRREQEQREGQERMRLSRSGGLTNGSRTGGLNGTLDEAYRPVSSVHWPNFGVEGGRGGAGVAGEEEAIRRGYHVSHYSDMESTRYTVSEMALDSPLSLRSPQPQQDGGRTKRAGERTSSAMMTTTSSPSSMRQSGVHSTPHGIGHFEPLLTFVSDSPNFPTLLSPSSMTSPTKRRARANQKATLQRQQQQQQDQLWSVNNQQTMVTSIGRQSLSPASHTAKGGGIDLGEEGRRVDIPYSPNGRRGSLTVQQLSPPPIFERPRHGHSGGARSTRRSMKADLGR